MVARGSPDGLLKSNSVLNFFLDLLQTLKKKSATVTLAYLRLGLCLVMVSPKPTMGPVLDRARTSDF